MKTSPSIRLVTGLIAVWSLLSLPFASAASSTALSNRTVVDSRDSFPIIALKPELADVTKENGRRFVSFQTQKESFVPATKYFSLKVPVFNSAGGGWGATQVGLGAFYGLEVMASGLTPGDTLQYKLGGAVPSSSTPASEWRSARFDTVIDITVSGGTYYFRVVNVPGTLPTPLSIYARFKSARFCNSEDGPIAGLNSSRPLWLLIHGKNDGANSFQTMNSALRNNSVSGSQIVSVDWSTGADGAGGPLPTDAEAANGRHFFNLAKNLASMLKQQGYIWNNVNIVGHSWGTLVGYETALSFGGVNRFIALDPAIQAGGGYDDDRVNFNRVSLTSTGVKGGSGTDGLAGSEKKAKTCAFSIRLLSDFHSGDETKLTDLSRLKFYHSLPRDWFIRAVRRDTSDVYWGLYFYDLIFRQEWRPSTPWGKINPGGLSGFDLECHGRTFYDKKSGVSRFNFHQYLLYEAPGGRNMEATAELKTAGPMIIDFKWSVKKH